MLRLEPRTTTLAVWQSTELLPLPKLSYYIPQHRATTFTKILPVLKNIININSIVGLEIKKNRTMYSATKWGLRGFYNSFKINSKAKVLDVYPSNIQTSPERTNALDIDFVVNSIYDAYLSDQTELILDGRI